MDNRGPGRPRIHKKIAGLSDREQDLVRKSTKVSKIMVGSTREEAILENPDLARELLQEEIKQARHQRARQKAINLRLTEEELRRADAHWRKSDTITKAGSLPARALEAGILITALGAGKTASEVFRESALSRELRAQGAFQDYVYQSASKSAAEEVARDVLNRYDPSAMGSLISRYEDKFGGDLTRDIEGTPGVVPLKDLDLADDIDDANIHRIAPTVDKKTLSKRLKSLRAGNEDDIRRALHDRKVAHSVIESMETMGEKEHLVGDVRIKRPAVLPTEKAQLYKSSIPFKDWDRRIQRIAVEKVAVDLPSAEIAEQAHIKKERNIRLIEANPLYRAQAKVGKAFESMGSTIANAITPDSLAENRINEGMLSGTLDDFKRSRKLSRTKVAIGVAAAAGAIAGAEIISRKVANAKENEILRSYGIDPSERVKRSWFERRKKYGPSGMR